MLGRENFQGQEFFVEETLEKEEREGAVAVRVRNRRARPFAAGDDAVEFRPAKKWEIKGQLEDRMN